MENSFNKGVRNLKNILIYILVAIVALFLINFVIKGAFYIGGAVLAIYIIYKLNTRGKVWFSQLSNSIKKKKFEKEMAKVKENKGGISYIEAEIVKQSNFDKINQKEYEYIDVDYKDVNN
ncbi:hypothetical protein C3495_04245 [Clostridiaceae bacterium 14S0207]|nr:hypothetical protein C3495_04245 [Clostridiaceae bacterium 14S0207]